MLLLVNCVRAIARCEPLTFRCLKILRIVSR